jgi:hypothetical protein
MRTHFQKVLVIAAIGGAWVAISEATAQETDLPSQPVPVLPPAGAAEPMPSAVPAPLPAPVALPVPPPPPPPDDLAPVSPPVIVTRAQPLGIWIDADYLLWWTKAGHVPPLVTAAVPSDAGVIGPANAATLFGGGDVNSGARSGGRFDLGFWFTDSQVLGLEAGYWFLADHSVRLAAGQEASSESPATFSPLVPDSTPPGTYRVALTNNLQSAELNLVANLARSEHVHLGVLSGFRYLQFDENLHVEQDFTSADFSEQDFWDDEFRTRNHFYGGQVGARLEYAYQRFFFDVTGKVALGVTDQHVTLAGGVTQAITTTSVDNFGNVIPTTQVAQSTSGGLLTEPAAFSRDRFAVVPEVGFNLGYQLTSYLRASVGYNFVYWSSVVRAGDQVSGVPRATSFWAQGLNLGLAFRF